jgi:hypothetical protein
MKEFTGYKAEKPSAGKEALPVGGYIAKILEAKEVSYDWGNVLLISFDIAEGEHKSFFQSDYAANTNEDKKWRGVYRLNEPKDNGTEQDGWTKNTFGNAMYAVEASNNGYHWNWDEKTLKGKSVGVLFRNFEWEMNGKNGWSTECGMLLSVDDIRSGKYKPMKDKPLKNKSASASNSYSSFAEIPDDEELPFK